MRVASHQPAFLPWPGFWDKFWETDVFVISAGVDWAKDSYLNRVRWNGGWLTVPVNVRQHAPILTARVGADANRLSALRRAVGSMMGMHRRYPYVERLSFLPDLIAAYEPGSLLYALNVELIRAIGGIVQPDTKIVVDTALPIAGTKTERLLDRIQRCAPGATEYLMGAGALDYIDLAALPLTVHQQDPSGYDPGVSILDVLGAEPDPVDYLVSRGRWVDLVRA